MSDCVVNQFCEAVSLVLPESMLADSVSRYCCAFRLSPVFVDVLVGHLINSILF